MNNLTLPNYEDVAAAAERIKDFINKTPVLTSRTVNNEFEAEVFFKCENFQRVGAFKFRGAMNALLQFNETQKKAGVVAFSSGNHAQAIALSSKILGIPATIIMPKDAPAAKMAATREYGGNIVEFDRYTEDREKIGKEIAEKNGLTLIPSYDHPHVIAGQGTAAKELFEEVGDLDYLFVCLGGGGLLAGSALSARQLSPNCKIYGVEPALGNDGQMSFRKGEIVHIDTPATIADGAQTQYLGKLTFPIIQQKVDDILTVTDEELINAMKFFAERMKMVVEPTGCLGFAAARNLKDELKGKRIGIIISGGNVDISKYAEFLSA
ncbi:threo-3-hydroxy-L-aspartate ammonia-lyase [Acinetobacter baumannii]|uniref:threo-3-hydroxy-L-aspartate ammonia-lyase n=2 Tax=Acinetobacter baumannii TaxID=470 RepID=UPI001CA87799|nr:threo-3-hydroxy-L-aspartate ammonia-lyase [Acinetobacter baumannii]EHU3424630.1 threo-3-hydroxy-L-aspartate ammonia-lyase [Acinetobacter baumannii]EHU3428114.1 threo-3-hydroxy-L-aspartate ammonia-lyase [Acinetobacter baumannii]MCX2993948.1 threo-3-hydroxy-L-aspartate ammonia-lyase [Acinetobacter baumannii]MDC5321643.1 threo-3-hydroxy-L-aspartate ammonia-lyase [Acinetobacter baumannii]MDO7488980.1 threo-3-hydroxy-L-aspartate ammonia-lyase [Acinetobacter baumannii]